MSIAVISGSASGIGACTKTRLEAQGFRVIGIDMKDADIIADLSSGEGRKSAVDSALEMSGGKIDRLVLAAGVGGHVESGQLVARAEETLTAEAARPEIARLLRVGHDTPLIIIDRLARGFDDTPLEWRRSRGRADQFHYHTEIR